MNSGMDKNLILAGFSFLLFMFWMRDRDLQVYNKSHKVIYDYMIEHIDIFTT